MAYKSGEVYCFLDGRIYRESLTDEAREWMLDLRAGEWSQYWHDHYGNMVNPFWNLCSTWSYTRASSSTALLRLRLTTESSRINAFIRSGLVRVLNALVTFADRSKRNLIQLEETSFKKR